MLCLLETLDFRLQRPGPLGDHFAELGGLCLQVGIAESLETLLLLENRIHDWLNALQRAIESRSKNLCEQTVCHYAP